MVGDLLAAMRQAETTDYRLQTAGNAEGGNLKDESERGQSDSAIESRVRSYLFCTDVEGELYETAPAVAKACGHRKPGLFIIDWRLVRQLIRFVRDNGVQVLHAHNHAPNLYCAIVSLLTGVPVVVTRHGRGYNTLRWRILSRVLSWRSKAVVFVSEDARRLAIETGSVSPKKAVVIHNGVDTRRFAPRETTDYRLQTTDLNAGGAGGQKPGVRSQESEVRKRLGIPQNAVVIGSVGRLSPEKNYSLLVRAFARLIRGETTDHEFQTTDDRLQTTDRGKDGGGETTDYRLQTTEYGQQSSCESCPSMLTPPSLRTSRLGVQNVFLLLVGDGNDRGRIEAEMERLGVKDWCHITGIQSDVLPWYQAMDVFCLSSDTEGLSISLLEAGACGLPSVVTDVGGNREVVVDGKTGMISPKGDEEALVTLLEHVIFDSGSRDEVGASARRRVVEVFSLKAMTRRYAKVYDEVISSKRMARR